MSRNKRVVVRRFRVLFATLPAFLLSLAGYGQVVEGSIEALKSPNASDRYQAAIALGKTKDARAIEPLIAALGDADFSVRLQAAGALGKLGEPAVDPLLLTLKNDDVNLRRGAAYALGEIKSSRAVDSLIAALDDGDSQVRLNAADALGKIRDPLSIQPLIRHLRDANSFQQAQQSMTDALGRIGATAVEPLLTVLNDADPNVRSSAARALGEIKDVRAVDPLVDALKDSNFEVRLQAAVALGKIRDPRSIQPLISRLNQNDPLDQRNVTNALIEIGQPAVDSLLKSLNDADWQLRRNAATALGEINDPRSTERLMRAFGERDVVIILGAYRFYIRRGEPGSEDSLTDVLNAKGDGRMAAAFLYCGNFKLASAGKNWIAEHRDPIIATLIGGPRVICSGTSPSSLRSLCAQGSGEVEKVPK